MKNQQNSIEFGNFKNISNDNNDDENDEINNNDNLKENSIKLLGSKREGD